MNTRSKLLQITTSVTLILFILYPVQSQISKRLFGSIYFDIALTVDKNIVFAPFHDFKIELLEYPIKAEVKDKKSTSTKIRTTYPDSNGYFSFKDVPDGKYKLQISRFLVDKTGLVNKIIKEESITVKYNEKGRYRIAPIAIYISTPPPDNH